MGGKPKSKSTSTSGSAQSWAQPFAQSAVQQVQNVVGQNQPGLQQLTDMTRNNLVNPLLGKFQSSLPGAANASGYYNDVVGGKYMQGNPYMGQVLDSLNSRVANDVNSHFALSGRYGSDAHGAGLTRELANADGQLMYQNYSDEAARRDAAAQALMAGNTADTGSLLSAIGAGAQLPYTGTSNLANSLGALFNGGTSTSTQTGPSPIWGAIGAGLGAAGSVFQGAGTFSDVRLKTNVELLHRDPDGLGWYSWNWKSQPNGDKAKGVLAHEVKELRPQAYIENYRGSGFDGVNYAAL